jgi:hypothetical protein
MPDLLPQSLLQERPPDAARCSNRSDADGNVANIDNDKASSKEVDKPENEVVDILAKLLCGLLATAARHEAGEFGCELAKYNCHQWESGTRSH